MNNFSKTAILWAALLLVIFIVIAQYFLKKNHTTLPPENPLIPAAVNKLPSRQDGKGTAVVVPSSDVAVSSRGTWRLVFSVAECGIAMGGGIAFHIPPYWGWTTPQNQRPSRPGYVTVSCSDKEAELDILIDPRLNYIIVRTANTGLSSGSTITLTYGDTREGLYPEARARSDRYAEQGERFFIKVDGDGDGHFFAINQHPTINILPGPPSRFIVNAPSIISANVPFTINVALVDRGDNWIHWDKQEVSLSALPAGAIFHPKQNDSRIISFECTVKKDGLYRFFASGGGNNSLSGVSNPVLCSSAAQPYRLYWGDLHGHSQLSDGTGTPADYFLYARLVGGLDAAALTDHDAHGFQALDENDEIWSFIKDISNRFNEPDKLATFIGYEWTNWTYGHKHVLFLDEPAPLYGFRSATSDTPDKLWKALKNYNAMTISHHVGGGPIAADWSFYDPEMEPVVEVCSIHGNSEYFGCLADIYNPKKGSFVQDALAKGYTLGLIAGGDTHNGHPGMGDPSARTGGVTAFYAEKPSREALWDALKKRRVYGTTGERIIIDFKINGHWMGEIVQDGPNVKREIYLKVIAADKLKKVEVIKNNQTLKSWEGLGTSCEYIIIDDNCETKRDYYYLRVVQENGQMAWSSPIWLECNQ